MMHHRLEPQAASKGARHTPPSRAATLCLEHPKPMDRDWAARLLAADGDGMALASSMQAMKVQTAAHCFLKSLSPADPAPPCCLQGAIEAAPPGVIMLELYPHSMPGGPAKAALLLRQLHSMGYTDMSHSG